MWRGHADRNRAGWDSRRIIAWLIPALLAVMSVACRLTPPASPVPVQGAREEITALSGEWAGRYWSQETGRRGTIRFSLPERADTGYGEVEIAFSPSLYLLQTESGQNALAQPKPCTTIDIRVVRVEDERVEGTMAPYWDPDCDCRAQTLFEGKISGNRITGSFSTRRESSDRRILTGKWEAERS